MAWPDGSKFLIANGVKWGTGPKFYPGPSVDTPWNHDLNWKTYCKHATDQDVKAEHVRMVQTPAKPSTISGLIRPGVPIYRPATPGKGGGSASGRSPTALSNAGKRMLQEATRGASAPRSRGAPRMRGGSSRSNRPITGARAPPASRASRMGTAAFTPTTRKDIAELKATLKQQTEAQRVVEQRMEQILEAVEVLKKTVEGGK